MALVVDVVEGAYDLLLKKFGAFTEIQNKAFPVVASGKNCIIIAPTGSGKTEAAFLPLIDKLSKEDNTEGIKIIYITPLRSLNRDMLLRLEGLCSDLNISIGVRHGDTSAAERALQSKYPPQVLITTPETLQNFFLSERLKRAMKRVKYVIVDEIHELYHNKRGAQLSIALERINELSPEFQRIGISATVADQTEIATFLCGYRECEIVNSSNKKEFDIKVDAPSRPKREHKELARVFTLDESAIARLEEISELIKENTATILFTNTRAVAESIGSKLNYIEAIEPFGGIGVHHGSLDRNERIKLETEFKNGKIKCIVATSSLELGIDVGRVDFVVQYGSPRQANRLIQRVGRGGHFEKKVSVGRIIVANAIDAIESAVIVKLAREQHLEKFSIEKNALDVLTNQISAIALSEKSISAEKLFEIITRTAAYAQLSREKFYELLNFADKVKLITLRDGIIFSGARTRKYFVGNISVLPEDRHITIKNYLSNKTVGMLDEKFVANYIDEGATFITKGLPWKAVSVEKDTIIAEPSTDFEAAVPDWEGEDIPVSYEVASEVFHYMKAENIQELEGIMSESAKLKVRNLIEKQKAYFIPEDKKIFVEQLDDYTVMHVALGKLANDLLGKIVAHIISAEIGTLIRVKSTPYSITIDYGNTTKRVKLQSIFEAIKSYTVDSNAIREIIAESDIFKYKFVDIAKLFGVIDKDASITKSGTNRLIAFYRDSPLFEETLRDVTSNYFDKVRVGDFIEKLRRREVEFVEVKSQNASALTEELFRSYYYNELLEPLKNDAELDIFLDSLLKKEMDLICTYCGFIFKRKIGDLWKSEQIVCPHCKSPMIATYKDGAESIIKKKRGGIRLKNIEYKAYVELMTEASLVEAYGGRAVLALSTYGVGTATAARVLRMLRRDYRLFVIDLINAQRTFIKNKKFWAAP